MARRDGLIVAAALLALLAWWAPAGCGRRGKAVDPKTRKLLRLRDQLGSESAVTRRQGADGLGKTGDPRAIPPLAGALNDSSDIVRIAAADALAGFGQAAREPLLAALKARADGAREAGAYGLGKLGDANLAEPLIDVLDDASPAVRAAAAESLAALRCRSAAPRLLAALADTHAGARQAAVHALARVADANTAAQLVAVLRERKSNRREPAREVLLKMGPAAVPAVAALLGQADSRSQGLAADLLGRIGGQRAADALADALKDTDAKRSAAHDRVVSALLKIDSIDPNDALAAALRSPNDRARVAAAKALAANGDPRAAGALVEALKANPSASDVIRALAALKSRQAVEPLLTAFRDAKAKNRGEIVRALGEIGDAMAAAPLLAELKALWPKRENKGSWRMIEALCSAMGKLRCAAAGDVLIEATAYQRDSYAGLFIRQAAARALGEIGETKAVGALIACTKDYEDRPRAAACEALGHLKDPKSVPPLIAALKDRNRPVRGAAANSLLELGPLALAPLLASLGDKDARLRAAVVNVLARMGEPAVGPLLERLAHADPVVRQTAAWAMGTIKDKRGLKPLIGALGDATAEVRGAAVWALREMGDPAAVEPLLKVLADPHERVRSEAITALARLGDDRAIEAIIPRLADDSAEVRRSAAAALGDFDDARAVAPLQRLVEAESRRLDERLTRLRKAGKLTKDGRPVRGEKIPREEQAAILALRSSRGAARIALERLNRKGK